MRCATFSIRGFAAGSREGSGLPSVLISVEWHREELCPRVGLVVTNLSAKLKGVVHFYNGRGIDEQWIKKGRPAVKWRRWFVADQVRLHLFILSL